MRCIRLIPSLALLVSALGAADPVPMTLAQFPDLPVTTGYLGNSVMRGGGIGYELFNPKSTYLQLYTEDMVASSDGTLFCTTTWEEGHSAAGMYRNGDALPDQPPFATSSGRAVAVNDRWLVYARKGELALFTREHGVAYQLASGRRIRYDADKDAPWGSGVVLTGDIAHVSSGGKLYAIDLVENKVIGDPVAIPPLERMRRDKRGVFWGVVSSKPEEFTTLPVTVSGDGEEGHPATDALRNEGDNVHWLDKTGSAALVIDLQQEARPAIVRFNGAAWGVNLVGAKISGAASAEGPWTELFTFEYEMKWWPETVVTLDERPWRYLRISSDQSAALRSLQVQVRTPPVPGAVIGVDDQGREVARLPDMDRPVGLDYDAANDRLLVFNNDTDQQIHAFNQLAAKPQRDTGWMQQGRFGAKGGLGSAKGVFGPARFDLVRGIAVDGKGNLNVFGVGGTGMSQSRLESYAPDGSPLWDMKGLAFLDAVETDPGDTNTAYSALTKYVRDPNGRDGDGWRAVSTTVDRFANPQDPRVHGNLAHIMGVRRIADKPILFVTSQYSNPMAAYRFDKDGIAVPSAFFVNVGGGRTFPPNQPTGSGWKMWQDANGDGLFQVNEWRVGAELMLHYFTVDSSGGVWFVDPRAKGIRHLGIAAGLDAHGSPTWPQNLERLYPAPAAFPDPGQMRGLEVSPDGKALFVFGFTPELPNVLGMNHPLGRLLVRYEITGTGLVETHRAIIPYDLTITAGTPKDQSYASSIAGDFLFIGYERHMDTLVLRHSDLSPVGRLPIGPQSQCPIYDGPSEFIATKVGARYEFFMSMYTGNATTQLTWDPSVTKRLDTPADPTGTRAGATVTLAWATIPGATAWQIERRSLLPDGWGPWQSMGKAKELSWTDGKAPAVSAYRIRAEGADKQLSDWSKTVWMR
jgi:hypothetical protein